MTTKADAVSITYVHVGVCGCVLVYLGVCLFMRLCACVCGCVPVYVFVAVLYSL